MQINVRLFAILREKAGTAGFVLELPDGADAGDALTRIGAQIPQIASLLPRVGLAINENYAKPEVVLSDGDEIALIPPVSGGMDEDWIELTAEGLSAMAAIHFVTRNEVGGIDLFLGITRSETSGNGRELLALEYEAHPSMARSQLKQLTLNARQQFAVARIALLHRVGRVEVGQASVVIAVGAAHRGAAFDACRFLIDQLKSTVAIWKQEVWDDRSRSWVHPGL